jgi:hypothetical protein
MRNPMYAQYIVSQQKPLGLSLPTKLNYDGSPAPRRVKKLNSSRVPRSNGRFLRDKNKYN